MPTYRINYSFNGYGHTFVEAEDEEQAKEEFYEGNYEGENEETENYEIDEVSSPEELAEERLRTEERSRNNNVIDNSHDFKDTENYCACGNPVEEKGEVCDQCWAKKIKAQEAKV